MFVTITDVVDFPSSSVEGKHLFSQCDSIIVTIDNTTKLDSPVCYKDVVVKQVVV